MIARPPRLSRRRRGVAAAAGAAGVVLLVGAGVVWSVVERSETYRPGEEVAGLTAELARGLPPDAPRVVLTDVAADAGVRFRHFPGTRSSQLPEDMGSGAAWGEYVGDGLDDLYIVDVAGPLATPGSDRPASGSGRPASAGGSALYHNEGGGRFRDVTEEAGVGFRGLGMGAAWGDYDGDGRLDLVVTAYGENVLYRNRGDGTFEDATRPSGLAGHVGFWTGAAWADYDRDGHLDLYITGYVRYQPDLATGTALQYDVEVPASLNPSSFRPERNLLFRNQGDGTFREVAREAGVAGTEGRGLSAAWADFDEDGWPDLYVANDVSDNALYRNRGDGTFVDASHGALVADYRGAMGLAVGDWDGDGDTDLFVTHWVAQENALFSNMRSALADVPEAARLRFADEADRWGLGQVALDYVGWGTSFIDVDNDGRLDLFVANGSTFQRAERPELLEPMPDQMFWNGGPERGFFDLSGVAGAHFERRLVGRGAAFADYDADGDVDVLVVNHGGPVALLRNDSEAAGGWLQVRLEGTRSNRTAIGAKVRIVAGGRAQRREIGAQSSYLSQNSLVAHFGLGPASAVDTLEVWWPSGATQRWTGLPANRRIHVREGEDRIGEGAGGEAPAAAAGSGARVPAGARVASGVGAREAERRFWEAFRRATRLRVDGRVGEAVAAYEEALALRPDHGDALYYLGALRLERGEFEAAEAAWERLARTASTAGRAHAQLGRLYACPAAGPRHDLARATAELERVRAINPEQTGPSLQLALLALARGRAAEADRHVGHVLGSDPASVGAWLLRAYVESRRSDRVASAGALDRLVEAARGEPVRAAASEEGDTRGEGPLLAASARCPELTATLDDLARRSADAWARGEGAEGGDAALRALAAWVERLAAGS